MVLVYVELFVAVEITACDANAALLKPGASTTNGIKISKIVKPMQIFFIQRTSKLMTALACTYGRPSIIAYAMRRDTMPSQSYCMIAKPFHKS